MMEMFNAITHAWLKNKRAGGDRVGNIELQRLKATLNTLLFYDFPPPLNAGLTWGEVGFSYSRDRSAFVYLNYGGSIQFYFLHRIEFSQKVKECDYAQLKLVLLRCLAQRSGTPCDQ